MLKDIHCSQLSRPMKCAGFAFFTDLPEQPETGPAREGTAAGEYLERLLKIPKQEYLPFLKAETVRAHLPAQARNGEYFTEEMRFHTMPIANEIMTDHDESEGIRTEQCIDWQTRSGIWIRGKYDVSFVRDNILRIDDLKFGWGLVEVEENWQLLGYAIGEVIRRRQAFDVIKLRIRQPRPHHEDGDCREWTLTYTELLGYKEQIEARMMDIASGFNQLQTGPQCKYCPAANNCPAFNRAFYSGVDYTFGFVQDEIGDSELAEQLDLVSRVEELIKIKKDSITALAIDRIKHGKLIPGYVTDQSFGHRSWKGGINPEVIKMLCGKDVAETVMVSPSQAEKLGVPRELVNQMTDKQFKGMRIVKKNGSDVGDKIFGKDAPSARA